MNLRLVAAWLALLLAPALGGCAPGHSGVSTGTAAASATASASGTGPGATATAPDGTAARDLHFIVASDAHLGDPRAGGNPYPDFVAAVNRLHAGDPLDFVLLNGDLAHGPAAHRRAKAALDRLQMPYFVTQGNHDELSPAQWLQLWGTEPDQLRRFGDRSIVLANTSDAAGSYLCPDHDALAGRLEAEAAQRDVLVFFHIPVKKWTKNDLDCPDVRKLLSSAANLRAVFNGHDHDLTAIKVSGGVHYLFDSHLGGHWGTPETGFREVVVGEHRLTTRIVGSGGGRTEESTLEW